MKRFYIFYPTIRLLQNYSSYPESELLRFHHRTAALLLLPLLQSLSALLDLSAARIQNESTLMLRFVLMLPLGFSNSPVFCPTFSSRHDTIGLHFSSQNLCRRLVLPDHLRRQE